MGIVPFPNANKTFMKVLKVYRENVPFITLELCENPPKGLYYPYLTLILSKFKAQLVRASEPGPGLRLVKLDMFELRRRFFLPVDFYLEAYEFVLLSCLIVPRAGRRQAEYKIRK